jgi:hypothetical protein
MHVMTCALNHCILTESYPPSRICKGSRICLYRLVVVCIILTIFCFVCRVGNALLLVSLVVGLVMGAVAVILELTTDIFADHGGNVRLVAFFLGFLVGAGCSSILLSTIGSGVNTVIVMFADAPNEFQTNHPTLSRNMRETWSQVYPGSI